MLDLLSEENLGPLFTQYFHKQAFYPLYSDRPLSQGRNGRGYSRLKFTLRCPLPLFPRVNYPALLAPSGRSVRTGAWHPHHHR